MIIAGAALAGVILGWFLRGWVTDLGARANAQMVAAMFGRAGPISQALREDRAPPLPGTTMEVRPNQSGGLNAFVSRPYPGDDPEKGG